MEIQPAQRCGVESHTAPWSVCGKIASKWFYIIQSDFSQEVAASPDHLGVSVIAIETYPSPPHHHRADEESSRMGSSVQAALD